MSKCKCGSGAINDDPKQTLCDCCWRDERIATLRKHLAAVCKATAVMIAAVNARAVFDISVPRDAVKAAEAYLKGEQPT
jgi:hypothetical protein